MAMYRTPDFKTDLIRGSYMYNLFDAREQQRDDGSKITQWGCTLITPESGLKVLTDAVKSCVSGQWGPAGLERLKKGLIRNPILAGDGPSGLDKETGEPKPGLGAGTWFIRPNTQRKPKVWVIRGGQYVEAAKEDCPSGWWGEAELHCYAWHNPKNGDGVSFGITQFLVRKEDEILGGSGSYGNPESAFGTIDASAAAGEGEKPSSAAAMFD